MLGLHEVVLVATFSVKHSDVSNSYIIVHLMLDKRVWNVWTQNMNIKKKPD